MHLSSLFKNGKKFLLLATYGKYVIVQKCELWNCIAHIWMESQQHSPHLIVFFFPLPPNSLWLFHSLLVVFCLQTKLFVTFSSPQHRCSSFEEEYSVLKEGCPTGCVELLQNKWMFSLDEVSIMKIFFDPVEVDFKSKKQRKKNTTKINSNPPFIK